MEQLSKEYFEQWMARITERQEQVMGELQQLKGQVAEANEDGIISFASVSITRKATFGHSSARTRRTRAARSPRK